MDHLRRVLSATLTAEIREQIDYHRGNAANLRRIHHVLHRAGHLCFVTTIAVLCLYLGLWLADHLVTPGHAAAAAAHDAPGSGLHHLLHDIVKPLVSVLAAGLPALGAALAGIDAQGGFSDRAERSLATYRQLDEIRAEIETLVTAPASALTLARTSSILLDATRVMMDDVQSWRQTYVGKALALPA